MMATPPLERGGTALGGCPDRLESAGVGPEAVSPVSSGQVRASVSGCGERGGDPGGVGADGSLSSPRRWRKARRSAGGPASRWAFASTEERTVLARVAARYGGFPVSRLGRGLEGLREGARRRPGSGDRPRDPPRNSASGDRVADYAARHRRGAGVGGGGHREGVPVLRRLAPPAGAPALPDAGRRRRTDAAAAPGPGGGSRPRRSANASSPDCRGERAAPPGNAPS